MLIFVIGAIVISIVSASDQNISVLYSKVQNPQLHFDKLQATSIVKSDLSPNQDLMETNDVKNAIGFQNKIRIPRGAIIHHVNNITTVFDVNGQQLLIANDREAEIIRTIKGDTPATFIHIVPNNSIIIEDGNSLQIFYDNSRILTIINDNTIPSYTPKMPRSCYGPPYDAQWIEGVESPASYSSLYQFSTQWNVPESPPAGTAPVAIWTGLYSCVPNTPSGLLQPVLFWNLQGYPGWSIASVYVWANATTPDGGDQILSPIFQGISTGDLIQGDIQPTRTNEVTITDVTTGSSSSLTYAQLHSIPNYSSQNLYPEITLEGLYPVLQPDAQFLPGPVIFHNFILTDTSANNLLPSTPMTNFKNLPVWDQNNFSDSQNLTIFNQWPTWVGLVNNPNRVNPPIPDFSTPYPVGIGPSTTVPFDQLSTGSQIQWLWEFGDGGISRDQYPGSHLYIWQGRFTVNLTVWGPGGVNKTVRPNFITIWWNPIAKFVTDKNRGEVPLTVNFTDTSTNMSTMWNWSFGDGNYSNMQNPAHTYTQIGTYDVRLTASNYAGNATSSPQTITVVTPILAPKFDGNPKFGSAWMNVQFTDQSSGGPIGWNWSFGDNSFSEEQNPFHVYKSYGNFTVGLTITNGTGYNTTSKSKFINANMPLPSANFNASPVRGTVPLTVQFNDTSVGLNLTGWNWSFGDKNVSKLPNPLFTYNIEGNYSINLTVSNGRYSTLVKTKYIDALPPIPNPSFYATPRKGNLTLAVTFTDTTPGNKTKWNWSFGDGKYAITANTTHTYPTWGNYTVSLNVSNRAGFNISTQPEYIVVAPAPPVANFSVNLTSGLVPLVVQFNDTSTKNATNWNWSFGDGNFSTDRNTTHVYQVDGRFNVILTASNLGGSSISTRKVTIRVIPILTSVAEFTSNTSSGSAPLIVSFTDLSLNNPDGRAWYFGDEDWTLPTWTQKSTSAGWTARMYHASVTLPNGSIVLMGGNDGTMKNDVWRSTDNGTTWTRINVSAGWTPRYTHSAVAMPDGSIVLMGGVDSSGDRNDVWCSKDNGTTWSQVTSSAGWSGRQALSSVVMRDGSILVSGGTTGDGTNQLKDVWRSTDSGATWTIVNPAANWSQRYGHSTVAMPDGSVVLFGGYTYGIGFLNDVWRSTDNGATWAQMNPGASWLRRYSHTSAAMPDGSILLMGGYTSDAYLKDVWRSTDNGATWIQVDPGAEWTARGYHTSVQMPDSSIVLMGGFNGVRNKNVWQFMPAGSLAQNPTHSYTAPGTYPVALQVYNFNGYNSTLKTGYVMVTGRMAPTAKFISNDTMGAELLAVQFTDTSSGFPTSWTWDFGDGNTSTLQNPGYQYTKAGNYTVTLSVINSAGTDSTIKTDYITVGGPDSAIAIKSRMRASAMAKNVTVDKTRVAR
jgi:PKD repeat protein